MGLIRRARTGMPGADNKGRCNRSGLLTGGNIMISRRRLLTVGLSAVAGGITSALFVARAQSAEFSYRYANNLPLTQPMNVRAREMADAVKKETKGRVE